MEWLWIPFVLGVIALGMYGGQKNKGARRFGIPGLAFLASLKGFKWRNLGLLGLIPLLSMGYGQNSFLAVLGHEWLIRLVYAGILSIPFFFWGFKRGVVSFVLLSGAFQIRAGSLGHISWFGDLLIEDIARYFALGICLVLVLKRKRLP